MSPGRRSPIDPHVEPRPAPPPRRAGLGRAFLLGLLALVIWGRRGNEGDLPALDLGQLDRRAPVTRLRTRPLERGEHAQEPFLVLGEDGKLRRDDPQAMPERARAYRETFDPERPYRREEPAAPRPPAAWTEGDLQLVCPPGFRVYVDGAYRGTSRVEEDGLYVEALRPGTHLVRIVGDGEARAQGEVQVQPGRTSELTLDVVPSLVQAEAGPTRRTQVEEAGGELFVRSVPLRGVVTLNGRAFPKNDDVLRIAPVPFGTHELGFERDGEVLQGRVTLGRARPEAWVQLHLRKGQLLTHLEPLFLERPPRPSLVNGLGMGLQWIPGELPGERGFWLGETEVTQAQFQEVMGFNPSWFEDPLRPVEQVRLRDAQEFCRRLAAREREQEGLPEGWSYALPRVEEWTRAARQVFDRQPALPVLERFAWYQDTAREETHPVAVKLPTPPALYDLWGNVWEWCEPARPGPLAPLVGGSYQDPGMFLRPGQVLRYHPARRNRRFGFRVLVRPGPQPG